jgi:hypothetical protein
MRNEEPELLIAERDIAERQERTKQNRAQIAALTRSFHQKFTTE